MDRNKLLAALPPFRNQAVLINDDQSVTDIVNEVLQAHMAFAKDYDAIADQFYSDDVYSIAKNLFQFCKKNIRYRIETEKEQTSRSPSAIVAISDGDCKHYAGFIAGVLDALNRQGANINWVYRFASYTPGDKEPQHVFVVVKDEGKDLWIDPVLDRLDKREPLPKYFFDKKTNMALHRLSGIDEADLEAAVSDDSNLSPQLVNAIQTLLFYEVIDTEGNVNESQVEKLEAELLPGEYTHIVDALSVLHGAAINGLFSTITRGIKKVIFFVPRNAYKALVALNVFGFATKLNRVISIKEGKDKVYDIWVKKFGGDWGSLFNAIQSGVKKKAILGQEPTTTAAAAAWVATATAIIAAIAPIVTAILNKMQQQGQQFTTEELAALQTQNNPNSGGGIIDWIKQNPLIAAGGAFVIYKFLIAPKTKRA